MTAISTARLKALEIHPSGLRLARTSSCAFFISSSSFPLIDSARSSSANSKVGTLPEIRMTFASAVICFSRRFRTSAYSRKRTSIQPNGMVDPAFFAHPSATVSSEATRQCAPV